MAQMDGLWWLLAVLGPLLILQRRLHLETQAVFLLLTRRAEITLVLFSLLFLPGVLLHELSHYLMARLLGVRTGRFSVLPQLLPDGRLQLGYVETASVDVFREALVGSAPLISGGLFVAYAGLSQMGLPGAWESALGGGFAAAWEALAALPGRPDFWLWFYLTFTVSSTMMPSASDRRAWLPVGLVFVGMLGLGLLLGAGPWLLDRLADPVNQALRSVALVFGIGVGVHLALLPPLWGARKALGRLTGMRVV
jgi:hypothetical protein